MVSLLNVVSWNVLTLSGQNSAHTSVQGRIQSALPDQHRQAQPDLRIIPTSDELPAYPAWRARCIDVSSHSESHKVRLLLHDGFAHGCALGTDTPSEAGILDICTLDEFTRGQEEGTPNPELGVRRVGQGAGGLGEGEELELLLVGDRSHGGTNQ